jgi:MSHA biogenesis protein MshQ
MLLLISTVSIAQAESDYIYSGGGTTNSTVNTSTPRAWYLTVNSPITFMGAQLNMNRNSATSLPAVLSVYSGVNASGTLLAQVSLPSSMFSTAFAIENFTFASPLILGPGTYFVRLTSTTPTNRSYTLRGLSNSIISPNGTTASTLASISQTAPFTTATAFTVSATSNATNCTPQVVSVTAKNGAATATAYTRNITLTTQSGTGTWTLVNGDGVFNQATANSGVATYTYAYSDLGTADFALTYSSGSSPITLRAYQTSNTSIAGTTPVSFYPSGFAITATTLNTPPFASALTAGTGANMYITAYGGSNLGDAVCGKLTSYNGTKTLKFWVTYSNPIASAGVIPTVNGATINTAQAGSSTQNVTFTNGQASVLFNYQDAGAIQISAQDTLSATTLVGSTDVFVVKPAQFAVSITSPINPAATSATDPVFVKAGAPFSATVQAKSSTGANTPNYGNETVPASVTLASSTVVLPVGGRNGSTNAGIIANGSNFTKTGPGLFSSSALSFDEVGIFKFTASVKGGDYLGAGNVSGPETGNIGRFYPNNFAVTGNSPAFNAGCVGCGFTYMDQPFSFAINPVVTVTAQSLGGTTTQNYTGNFWRLLLSSLNPTYTSSSTLTLNSSSPVSSVTFVDNGNGTGTYTFGSGTGFKLQRVSAVSLSPPESLEVRLASTYTDQDGVTYASNPYVFGGTATGTGISFNGGKTFYFGRMTLANTSGSELAPLSVAFQTEYYNGTDFQVNTADNGTSFSNPAWVSITPTPNTLSTTVSITPISNGIGAFTLSAPSPSGTLGSVVVQPNLSSAGANLPWLQFAWPSNASNTTGLLTDNPSAVATFGIPEGVEQIIYQNEVFR